MQSVTRAPVTFDQEQSTSRFEQVAQRRSTRGGSRSAHSRWRQTSASNDAAETGAQRHPSLEINPLPEARALAGRARSSR